MKKIVIAILIILVGIAAWAGGTHVVGGQVEQHYQAGLDQISQWGPVRLVERDFERGFFRSQARTVIEVNLPDTAANQNGNLPDKVLHLTFSHEIHNGPLPLGTTPGGGLSMAPKLAWIETRLVDATLGDLGYETILAEVPEIGEAYALTSIGLTGGGSNRVMIPAFDKAIEEEKVTLSWGGLTCDADFSRGMKEIAGKISLPGVQIEGQNGNHMKWDGIQANFDMNEAFPMVYVGHSDLHFSTMKLAFTDAPEGDKELMIEGLDFTSDASREGGSVEYLQSIQIGKVNVDGEIYGPGQVDLAARNLDGEALSRYQSGVMEVYRDAAFEPEAMAMRLMPVYMQLLTDLAKGSPEIEFSQLQFSTPMGDFQGNLRVKYNGGEGQVLGNMAALAGNLEAEAMLTADETLVRTVIQGKLEKELEAARRQEDAPELSEENMRKLVDRQLETLAAQQFIEVKDGKVNSRAVFNRGQLTVNGRQLM